MGAFLLCRGRQITERTCQRWSPDNGGVFQTDSIYIESLVPYSGPSTLPSAPVSSA